MLAIDFFDQRWAKNGEPHVFQQLPSFSDPKTEKYTPWEIQLGLQHKNSSVFKKFLMKNVHLFTWVDLEIATHGAAHRSPILRCSTMLSTQLFFTCTRNSLAFYNRHKEIKKHWIHCPGTCQKIVVSAFKLSWIVITGMCVMHFNFILSVICVVSLEGQLPSDSQRTST